MATVYGLQTRDANGKITLDTTDYTFWVKGSFKTGTSAGNFTSSDITANTKVIIIGCTAQNKNTGLYMPVFTVSAGKISWTFKEAYAKSTVGLYTGYNGKTKVNEVYDTTPGAANYLSFDCIYGD